MRPYALRRLEADKAGDEKVQAFLARVVREFHDLTDDERKESERLISLPFGADDFALGRFISRHRLLVAP